MTDDWTSDRGRLARRLIRGGRAHAALATNFVGRPYASLVAVACDLDATPLLLLSDLAQHSKNLRANPQAALLFEEARDAAADPLAAARLTVLGHAEPCNEPRAAARFAARHPASANYAGFADFRLYRLVVERGHLVVGFGRITWIEAAELRLAADATALAAAETEIVAHMNADHAEAVALYAQRLLGRRGSGWRMTGIDPEGIDLRNSATGETARLDFDAPVLSPAAARHTLVALAATARQSQEQ